MSATTQRWGKKIKYRCGCWDFSIDEQTGHKNKPTKQKQTIYIFTRTKFINLFLFRI